MRCDDKRDGEKLQEQCLRPEQLAAYVEGNLTWEEQPLIEHHLAECNHCRMRVEIMIKSQSEVPSPLPPNSDKKS
jgi:anti-sigma factor ChrR (cupin superfamily)